MYLYLYNIHISISITLLTHLPIKHPRTIPILVTYRHNFHEGLHRDYCAHTSTRPIPLNGSPAKQQHHIPTHKTTTHHAPYFNRQGGRSKLESWLNRYPQPRKHFRFQFTYSPWLVAQSTIHPLTKAIPWWVVHHHHPLELLKSIPN